MKPVREWMKDPRAAAGLGGLALLFVVYRVTHTGKPSAPPALPDNGASAAVSTVAPPPFDYAVAASVPKGDVAWNWERNPFIGPSKKHVASVGEEAFPAIIVPGFGGKEKTPVLMPAAAPGADAGPKVAEASVADEALPELRGTVLSGGRGIAIFGTRLVPSGDQVAGWTVERVTAYDVALRKGGDRCTIAVFKPDNGGKP